MKKTILKKVMCLTLALTMFASLCTGCSGDNAGGEEEKTYKVGICQLVQHDALDAATQGFQDALKEKLGDRVEFDLQNAAGDNPTCGTIKSGCY